jgi:hypothetical protein
VSDPLVRLSERISDEVVKINLAVQRAKRGWHDFQSSGNDLFLDSISLSLQGAYNGVEVIFELISRLVDRNQAKGENWHQLLLRQMMAEVEGVRPAVISLESGRLLNDFRGFRHVTRHLYPFELEGERIAQVMQFAEPTFARVCTELSAFANFLLASVDPGETL